MRAVLNCFSLSVLLYACNGRTESSVEKNAPIYSPPLSFVLNTSGGYPINQLTGDSIKPFISSSADTIKTGVSIPVITTIIGNEIIQPTIIEGVQTVETMIPGNVFIVPDKRSITVDTSLLKKVKLGDGDQLHIVRNAFGIVPTGVSIQLTGKIMSFSEPHPVKAAPMRQKDKATTNIQYLDVDQGLSYSYIYDVCEDSKGNLWFGSDAFGVCKYDGINITTYTEKEGLSNNTVTRIIEDRNKNIWFGTNAGVTRFDGINFTQFTEKEGFPNNEILSITEDSKGNIWFCTKSGLTKYNGKSFIQYTRKEGLLSDTVLECIEDKKGHIWIASQGGGLTEFDGNRFVLYTDKNSLKSNWLSTLLEDDDGNIWIGSANGISKFDGKAFTHFDKTDGLSDNIIWSMIKDKKGNLWISTAGGGINKFNGKTFTQYKPEQGLSNIKVRRMAEDRSGNIWFGTDGGGVNKLNSNSFDYVLPEGLMDNGRIRPILKDKNGNIWFGTEGGHIGKLDAEQKAKDGKLFTYYKIQDKLVVKGQRSLLEDKKGNIWIGTTGSGIIKYDGKKFTNYSLGKNPDEQTIYDLKEDKKGNIWVGTRDGKIIKYNGKNFIQYSIKGGLPGTIIYSILEDQKGNTWFCTEKGGIYKYNGETCIIYSAKEGLFNKSITSITEDDKGNIWLGTLGAGVCKFDGKNFVYYSTSQGLADNNIWSVFYDSTKQLWFGTDKGLTLFVPQNNDLEETKTNYYTYNFGLQDGLKALDFNLHSFCVDDNNHIWWGTGKNAPSFDLNKGFHADSLRSLKLSHIEINDRAYDFRNTTAANEKKIRFSTVLPYTSYPENLSLPYDQNHLTFHFSAIDWSAPHKIKYSYRLMGFDEKWSKPSEEPKVDYRNLGHGNYQFQVKAIGLSQKWTTTFTYGFVIRPAWWQTWWFKLFIVLAAIALLLFVARLIYLSRLRKQKTLMEKELAVQLERQRISSEMHDDIGAGLSGVRLLTEITRSKLKDADASTEMNKIYESVGEISAKMKEVIWSLNTENDDIASLAAFIQKQTRAMLEYYPCELLMDIPSSFPSITISGEARRNIYLTVKEVLHNIIKHSGADKIQVTVTCNEKLSIRISDNGKGFSADAVGKNGNGLRNMKQRMEKLNGSFVIQNNQGTIIILVIPLKTSL